MNRSFGYVPRRRRRGRTARRRRRNQRERGDETLDRLFGLGRFALPARRQEVMTWGALRAQRESEYARQRGRKRLGNALQQEFGLPPPRERDPRNVWDAPPAAGGGNELMSQRGGILPGHSNIQQRPVTTAEAAAFPASHHSGHPVSNPRRGTGVNTNTMRSISEMFQRQTGGNVFYNKLN